MNHYVIEFLNSYGHVIHNIYIDCKTDKTAIQKAKREKAKEGIIYPDTAWIEIINLDTKKRIYV